MKEINASLLQKMFIGGAQRLEAHKDYINELNVFPVPDGDTGTNMTMTIMSAAKEVSALDAPSIKELSKAISGGSLRGARGNSGVILSQLFRGFTKAIQDHETLTTKILAEGAHKAVETAYKAVMKPKEGTILTVARVTAEYAGRIARNVDEMEEFMDLVIEEAKQALATTPDLLPVLKEAGVVDSGGQGLLEVLIGGAEVLSGKEIAVSDFASGSGGAAGTAASGAASVGQTDIAFGYCTEFIVMVEKQFDDLEEKAFKDFLMQIGDSIVLVADDGLIKVHVHTNHPGRAIEKGLSYGSLTSMKIDNMREEHEEILHLNQVEAEASSAEQPHKAAGFVAVSIGSGLNGIFKELGVDKLIEGGQTMNPSTEDMLNAVQSVNADTVYVLPNNKNIILAAQQARALATDQNVVIIPTTTVPQGISAMIAYEADGDAASNEEAMCDAARGVKTGEITYAVRDTVLNGKEIKVNDIMGLDDSGIQAVGKTIDSVAVDLTKELVDSDSELICLYYGAGIKEEEAQALSDQISKLYEDCDVQVQYGGQPVYYYLMSVE